MAAEDYFRLRLVNNPTSNFLSIDVFLPEGAQELDNSNSSYKNYKTTYYRGSRFEHGSMIGNFQFRPSTPIANTDPALPVATNVLYGTDLWRIPHNVEWPESGIGLASEFGVGDDGDFCFYRCGWNLASDITNGVLGYRQAQPGQPFLKIGVGKLYKSSCPACDSTEDYKFNSPYRFAERPLWTVSQQPPQDQQQVVIMRHEASIPGPDGQIQVGYQLMKRIEFNETSNELTVTTTLVNTGKDDFSTVWYSHNFFHCNGIAVGPGYAVELDLDYYRNTNTNTNSGNDGGTGGNDPFYQEPGTWSWSTPLAEYATVKRTAVSSTGNPSKIRIDMKRALDPGIRIKTEFNRPPNGGLPDFGRGSTVQGGFTLEACGSRIATSLEPASAVGPPLEMYAYNLYIERGTFSPEPQILLHVPGRGGSQSWKQRLSVTSLTQPSSLSSNKDAPPRIYSFLHDTLAAVAGGSSSSSSSLSTSQGTTAAAAGPCFGILIVTTLLALWAVSSSARHRRRLHRRRRHNVEQKRLLYSRIEEGEEQHLLFDPKEEHDDDTDQEDEEQKREELQEHGFGSRRDNAISVTGTTATVNCYSSREGEQDM